MAYCVCGVTVALVICNELIVTFALALPLKSLIPPLPSRSPFVVPGAPGVALPVPFAPGTLVVVKVAVLVTVLPKVNVDMDKSGKLTEADFMLFLKERGDVKNPKGDLNGDGKRDYQDDYIFAGNYILQAGIDLKELAKERERTKPKEQDKAKGKTTEKPVEKPKKK